MDCCKGNEKTQNIIHAFYFYLFIFIFIFIFLFLYLFLSFNITYYIFFGINDVPQPQDDANDLSIVNINLLSYILFEKSSY